MILVQKRIKSRKLVLTLGSTLAHNPTTTPENSILASIINPLEAVKVISQLFDQFAADNGWFYGPSHRQSNPWILISLQLTGTDKAEGFWNHFQQLREAPGIVDLEVKLALKRLSFPQTVSALL